MTDVLLKVRLSYFFFIIFVLFIVVGYLVPGVTLIPASLTLFSVNSFLFGFYISPIMTGQKGRIEQLGQIIRAEASTLFSMLIKTKRLPRQSRNHVQAMIDAYIVASVDQRGPAEGEKEYEALIAYCLDYEGDEQETVDKILADLVDNQKNRSQLAMQLENKVYSNEWWIVLVLWSITIGFVLLIDIKDSLMMHIIKALLCAGLSMLMLSLLKLSTLTHKKARRIWDPLSTLSVSRFRRMD